MNSIGGDSVTVQDRFFCFVCRKAVLSVGENTNSIRRVDPHSCRLDLQRDMQIFDTIAPQEDQEDMRPKERERGKKSDGRRV